MGAEYCVCTLRSCDNGSTLGDGASMMVISGGWKISFWLYGSIGSNGKIFMRGWDLLLWKIWEIWLIKIFVASS